MPNADFIEIIVFFRKDDIQKKWVGFSSNPLTQRQRLIQILMRMLFDPMRKVTNRMGTLWNERRK